MRNLPKITLTLIIIAYISFAFVMSHVANFNKGPDEETNLAYTEFIVDQGRLPVTYEERELIGKDSNWPALYHIIVAKISNGLGIDVDGPPHIKIFWDSFRYRAIDTGGEWYYLRTEDQEWPYFGRILVLHIGRWLSILFGVVTLLLVYGVILELLPNQPWLAVSAVAILAFLPIYTFMSSVMNEDTMMAVLATLYLWMLILVLKAPEKVWRYVVMGLALGVSVTVKYTTIILPLEVVVILAVFAWRKGYPWQWWLKRIALVGGSAILASSWWFGWNFWYLNEIEERGWLTGLLRPIFTGGPDITLSRLGYLFSGGEIGLSGIPEGREAGTFLEWIQKTTVSFWGVSIDNVIPLSPYIYLFVTVVVAVAASGLWRLWREQADARQWLLLLLFHIGIFFILPLLRFTLTRRIGETAQGRHILLPTVAAVVLLIVWGIATAVSRRWQGWLFAVVIVGFVFWTGAHLDRLIKFTPTPVPMRTLPQAAEWLPYPIKAQFGDTIELVSYDLNPQPERGLLRLDLAWRSLAHTQENYALTVFLLNAQGQTVSYWTGYNGQGKLPTLAWDPGDTVFDRLALPLVDLPVGNYTVMVEVADSTGPLAIQREESGQQISARLGDQMNRLSLVDVSIDKPVKLSLPRNLEIAGEGLAQPIQVDFDVWQADGPVDTDRPTYRYPATISIVTSRHDLDVVLIDETDQEWSSTHTEANIYTFVVGPRWPSGDYRLQMTLREGDKPTTQVTGQPALIVENWWERQFEAPEIEHILEANFANQIRLLGYKLPQSKVKAGQAFPITLYWQAPPERSPQANFIQFNTLLDSNGITRGGYNRRPLEYYSTLLWAPAEVVVDGYAVPVDPNAPPGEYYLNVGYYLAVGESAVNLPLVVDGQMTGVSSVTIGPIEVIAP